MEKVKKMMGLVGLYRDLGVFDGEWSLEMVSGLVGGVILVLDLGEGRGGCHCQSKSYCNNVRSTDCTTRKGSCWDDEKD
jgi:hypothetical protein